MLEKEIDEMSDMEFWSEVANKPPKVRLKMMKKRCRGNDKKACLAYQRAIEGDPDTGARGLRQLWEEEGNEVAKEVLEELGELEKKIEGGS